jgi:serine/threonine protein kinase/Tol biopolymer transport system component
VIILGRGHFLLRTFIVDLALQLQADGAKASEMGMKRQDIELALLEALEKQTPEERAVYLDQVCGDDVGMRAELDSLLEFHQQAGDFLVSGPLAQGVTLDESPLTEEPGTIIGRYKLLEKIGEGGMAVVYMAEQTEPIHRKVALKIIKLGMDTRQVIARFEAERQALALMDHPSIAKVLDAGATETGRPYFVMELVQGVSITEYCDKNSLSTKDRLALFLQVCHAVQHAHQKGIIHRDIKPSNVMVTHHDGKPVPKVIDFGIAKATNQKLTEKTLFTRYAHLIGTPAYMSPEQAELSDLDIDTRSDIYSLGVLLYELLTGTTPFSEEELRKAGYLEMQRVIREQEPVKPSTRIRTALRGASGPARRSGTGETPVVLMGGTPMLREVRGDLDWIVMKALEKDRTRRYDTASGLAEDVRRHLEHEPVLARGPSTTYRLQRFLRRHRLQVVAALVLALVALAAGGVLLLWNQAQFQLAEAEGLRDRGILSQAREQYAKADRQGALGTIWPVLTSKHIGPEARLLQATILVDNRHPDEAATILNNLLNESPEVAGAAHGLLARILWESGASDTANLKEMEEHRQKAEALLPETAEAYFLRAMTSLTVKEELASLDRALQLDSSHYETRRLRAFTYYASRKYDRLQADALVMSVLRPRDPLGYSLRAVAWRESGRYKDAIADYDNALSLTPKDSPEFLDLSVQRGETLLRMGDYERVIADSVGAKGLSPLRQYHVFCALTARGEYEKATALYRQIIAPGRNARRQFQDWCANYVFDTSEAGRVWHPSDHEPAGAAFLPMVEAEETYRSLSAKGRRVTTDGFSARWSPDGKKLAFSLGVQGYSGVAVFDPRTKETDLLIVPGKDPRWSPDGKYLAFVRDCQALRLEELATAERENQHRPVIDEEVWLMKSDGTEPRRLAQGSWPSWSQDSRTVYYGSRADNALCSISIAGRAAKPKRIMACSSSCPSVSPDNQRLAYLEGGVLKVKDLASQAAATEQPVPFATWGPVGWSPTGCELCLAGRNDSDDRTGLWICGFDGSGPVRVLDGQIADGAWTSDGTKLVFCLGAPYLEIWAADLAPTIPAVEALGPSQTLDEHFREMVSFYTRRIEADPLDARAYSSRARYYGYLGDAEKAHTDMRRYSAILSRAASSDVDVATSRRLMGAISSPSGYQLAFSVGRRNNGILVLCVALGQKGRCEMRVLEIPLFVASLLGFCLVSGTDVPPAHAGFILGEPVNVGPPINTQYDDSSPFISTDGLSLYFTSNREGGSGDYDIWMTTRTSTDHPWSEPVNLGSGINTPGIEWHPSITADGLELYFDSDRPGGEGYWDLWVAKRESVDDNWGTPVNLGPKINTPGAEESSNISPDGLVLRWASDRPGGHGDLDIWVTRRATRDDPWSEPVNLGSAINTENIECNAVISADSLVLFFARFPWPDGYGDIDIGMSRWSSASAAWQTPVNLGPAINTPNSEYCPSISSDGTALYFSDWPLSRPGGDGAEDIWQAPILPIVDFNADGKVDLVDLVMLIDDWGTDQTLCDIGPMPWGDGKVDIEDLKVFMTHYEKANPPGANAGQ